MDTPRPLQSPVSHALLPQDQDHWQKAPVTQTSENAEHASEKSHSGYSPPTANPWVTSFIRFGPLSGLTALFIALLSIFASMAVLRASDGSPTVNWKLQPSVFLSILTAIGNQATRYAAVQGATISWWVGALKVSSLSRLHKQWESSSSPIRAIAHGHRMSILGLACLLSTLVALDGPLLQRASRVSTAPIAGQYTSLTTLIAPEVPHGFTGSWAWAPNTTTTVLGKLAPAANGSVTARIDAGQGTSFLEIQSQFAQNTPLSGFIEGCEGTCQATLQGPALAVHACRNWVIPVDYWQPIDHSSPAQAHEPHLTTRYPIDRYSFLNYIQLVPNGTEVLDLVTGYTPVQNYSGIFNLTACSLVSAIGEYDVSITDNVATLNNPRTPCIVARANNTGVDPQERSTLLHPSTLGGLVELFASLYEALFVYISPDHDGQPFGYDSGPIAQWEIPGINGCPAFRNQQDELVGKLNEVMFRADIFAAQKYNTSQLEPLLDDGLKINSTVVGTITGSHSVYTSTYAYFIAAAVVNVVSIGLLLTTYWGWWRLGRAVSHSPLEIAKAFDAPLLKECHSNSTGAELIKSLGEQRVCYGIRRTDGDSPKGAIAFAKLFLVSSPKSHATFDT